MGRRRELTERQRFALSLKREGLKLWEIGSYFGIGREGARQLVNRALRNSVQVLHKKRDN
jgi:DNA-binding CsgD family transcriptional regulator